MNGFLTVMPGAAPRSIAVGASASMGPKQASQDSGIIAEIPKHLKGNLARENHYLGFEHNVTSHPIPCSSINQRAAQATAIAV